jgi:hypothetical protein
MRSFCQDSLGANIGRALKTEALFRRRPTRGVKATLLLLRYEIPIAPWQTIICQDRLGTNIGKSILKKREGRSNAWCCKPGSERAGGKLCAARCSSEWRESDNDDSNHPAWDLVTVWCGKRLLLSLFILKMITLPRQARDKHREKLRKMRSLLQIRRVATTQSHHRSGLAKYRCRSRPLQCTVR